MIQNEELEMFEPLQTWLPAEKPAFILPENTKKVLFRSLEVGEEFFFDKKKFVKTDSRRASVVDGAEEYIFEGKNFVTVEKKDNPDDGYYHYPPTLNSDSDDEIDPYLAVPISLDVYAVQAMTAPTGRIFSMRARYTDICSDSTIRDAYLSYYNLDDTMNSKQSDEEYIVYTSPPFIQRLDI